MLFYDRRSAAKKAQVQFSTLSYFRNILFIGEEISLQRGEANFIYNSIRLGNTERIRRRNTPRNTAFCGLKQLPDDEHKPCGGYELVEWLTPNVMLPPQCLR